MILIYIYLYLLILIYRSLIKVRLLNVSQSAQVSRYTKFYSYLRFRGAIKITIVIQVTA